MVGPVLLKQDKTEAVMAVDARLDFIENEMYAPLSNEFWGYYWLKDRKRVEKQIKDVQDKSDALRSEVSYTILSGNYAGLILNQIIQIQSETQPQGAQPQAVA